MEARETSGQCNAPCNLRMMRAGVKEWTAATVSLQCQNKGARQRNRTKQRNSSDQGDEAW